MSNSSRKLANKSSTSVGIFFIQFCLLTGWASPSKAADDEHPTYATPGFNARGLNLETELTAIYLGDFDHAPNPPTSFLYTILLSSYISTFFQKCANLLPADKIETMTMECEKERITERGGVEIGRICIDYRPHPSGVLTTRELFAAKQKAEDNAPRMAGAIMRNPIGQMRQTFKLRKAADEDVERLLTMNGCNGPGIGRFQDNLARFGLSQSPLRLQGAVTLDSVRASGNSVLSTAEITRMGSCSPRLRAQGIQQWKNNSVVQGETPEWHEALMKCVRTPK